jgi:DNA invertase Pin-like site-specific DNA recombinase
VSEGAGAIVVARHDRLARETLQALLIEQACAQHGVRVLYAEGHNGEGDDAKFLRTIMHAAAEQQKRELVRKLRQGRAIKAREHPASRAQGGKVPFGYQRTATALEIDADQAAIVRRMFDLIASGASIKQTAEAMSSAERTWHPTAVRRIVTRPIYMQRVNGERPLIDARIWHKAERALAARRPEKALAGLARRR